MSDLRPPTAQPSTPQPPTAQASTAQASTAQPPTPQASTAPPPTPQQLDYLRRLYADVLGWYHSADTKGQVLLTVNGILVTVLAGAAFSDPGDVSARIRVFGAETWLFLALTATCVLGSVLAAAMCLRSRLKPPGVAEVPGRDAAAPAGPSRYPPAVGWWFGAIARLPREESEAMLGDADPTFEAAAMAAAVTALAPNVLRKHRWVNAGWTLLALALAALVAVVASYLVRL